MTKKILKHANINIVADFAEAKGEGRKTITVVVPCYNEEKRLQLRAFRDFLQANSDVNLLFVNDGSQDQTLNVLELLRAMAHNRVKILNLPQNVGKAEAVRQGLRQSIDEGADIVGYWDADLATPLDTIADFTRTLEKFDDLHVVYGARRHLLGHRIRRTTTRRMISRICAFLARRAIGLPVNDTQCGAKLFRVSGVLRDAVAKPFRSDWLFDVELFTRIASGVEQKMNAFYEYPLPQWDEIAGSKVSPRAVLHSGVAMLQLIAEAHVGVDFQTQERAVDTSSDQSAKLDKAA